MNTEDAIRRAVPILSQYGSADPMILKAWLLRVGLTHPQVHDVIRFVPLALGRDVLTGLGVDFPDTYVRIRKGSDAQEERSLAAEPFFAKTKELAPVLAAEHGFDAVANVAMSSSEFQALNSALNAGADPANLVAGPPVMEWERDDSSAEKPWWKFW
jgi:hypothetical protein